MQGQIICHGNWFTITEDSKYSIGEFFKINSFDLGNPLVM